MTSSKKGNNYHFGKEAHTLCHGEENVVFADSAYRA
jgi:IS5 family transposase